MNDKDLDQLIRDIFEDEIKIPEGLSERLESNLRMYEPADVPVKKSNKFLIISSIAASILLCIGLFFAINSHSQDSDKLADTFQDPIEAEMYAEKALMMVSENLNKGLKPLEKAKENIDITNQVLNNNLTFK